MDHSRNVPTPHNEAKSGEIAGTVLMPGDPLRAEFIARTYLESPARFNGVRGMLGFTGMFKGARVSVMGSGMGMPSIGIYSYELFDFYGVRNIIRVGSCGAYIPELKCRDTVLVTESHSESTFYEVMAGCADKVTYPSPVLNGAITQAAAELNIALIKGPIHSGDCFYSTRDDYYLRVRESTGAIATEMESFALFATARVLGGRAACLLTVSDNIVTHEEVSSEVRQNAFVDMMEIALNAAVKLESMKPGDFES